MSSLYLMSFISFFQGLPLRKDPKGTHSTRRPHRERSKMTFSKVKRDRNFELDFSTNGFTFNMRTVILVFCVLSFTCWIHPGSGFNVDVSSKIIHTAPKDSCDQECMFGFSVAQHRERGVPW